MGQREEEDDRVGGRDGATEIEKEVASCSQLTSTHI